MTHYERYTIKPILDAIEKHQDFLCKPENKPQLAKLGYMFEKLWYSGRVAYGTEGKVKKGYDCEDNPKYILEDIEYNSDKNESIIYDAWGMHVSMDVIPLSYDVFKSLILEGKGLSDFEKQHRKPHKTFDEWVEVLTDKNYRYNSIFPDRISVANFLLCTIGTGYSYDKESGTIIKTASGSGEDQDGYGDWENAKFIPEIQVFVDSVLNYTKTKIAVEATYDFIKDIKDKEDAKKLEMEKKHGSINNIILNRINKALKDVGKEPITEENELFNTYSDLMMNSLLNGTVFSTEDVKPKKREWYPICNYSNIMKLDENTHPSYIKMSLEICEDHINNKPEIKEDWNDYQKEQRNEAIEFSEKFVERWSV